MLLRQPMPSRRAACQAQTVRRPGRLFNREVLLKPPPGRPTPDGTTTTTTSEQTSPGPTSATSDSMDVAQAPAVTFADLASLAGMFPFAHIHVDAQQEAPTWLLSKFKAFLGSQRVPSAVWPGLSPGRLERLNTAVSLLHSLGAGVEVKWLPKFGCALLPLPPPSAAVLQPGHVQLHLVAADGWAFDMHSTPSTTNHTARSSALTVINCATVPAEQLTSLLQTMEGIMAQQKALKQQQKSKNDSGLGGKSHFQHTPAFVLSAVHAALSFVRSDSTAADAGDRKVPFPAPKGGCTDVGQHTGSRARGTTWPLFTSMLQAVLQLTADASTDTSTASGTELQQLFDESMMQFALWLLQELLPQLTPAAAVPAAVDACMTMLQSVAGKAAELAVAGVDVAAVDEALSTARQQVDAAVAERMQQAAARFELPAGAEATTAAAGTWRLPWGRLPPQMQAAAQQRGPDAIAAQAEANLGSLPVIQGASLPVLLPKLLQLLSGAKGDVALQHALRSTEHALYTEAAAGFKQPALSASEVDQLAQVVDSYRVALKAFRATTAAAGPLAMLHCELRSREVLVAWVAYCLAHKAAAAAHPRVLQYGVALSFEQLRHLSLTDKAATDAALGVCMYLQQHSKPGSKLFHLGDQGPTQRFAEGHAAADASMCAMLADHQAAAERRMDEHWKKVQKRQQEAADLRAKIAALQDEVAELRSKRDMYDYYDQEYREYQSKADKRASLLRYTESDLAATLKPLDPVIQPLPRQRSLALQWLFMLHMPQLLRCLLHASCLAQQLLLPQPLPPDLLSTLPVKGLNTSLCAHYNHYQSTGSLYYTPPQQYEGADGVDDSTKAFASGKVPVAKELRPSSIDGYSSRQSGVFFPDSPVWQPALAYQSINSAADSGVMPSGFFNPFTPADSKLVTDSFTAKFSQKFSSLQWVMPQYGSISSIEADRGNWGLAWQNLAPEGISKPEFAALAALRSFPHRQLHRLCDCLRDKQLPLDHPAVQLLVQQTVFELGELVCDPSCSPAAVRQLWRTGWDAAGGVLEALQYELQQLADELSNKPREQGSVLLLGQLAAYLSDWHPPCKAVAQQFAAMTSQHADVQLQQQIDEVVTKAPDEAALAELKAKQTHWRAMSLLCFAAGPLEPHEAGSMLRLMLQIKHADVYQLCKATAAELAALRVLCHDTMARRLPEILHQLDKQPQLLTDAAASILESLQQQPAGPPPPQLPWERVNKQGSTGSYQAQGSDGHLYSIMVLDGTLLFDGNPPGRLPTSILQHRLYVRTFGSTNHEVKTTADGQLETIRPISGRFYRFNLSAAESNPFEDDQQQQQLVITELDPTQSGLGVLELQLLDTGPDDGCEGWGNDLPVRLRKLHSHWLDRQHGVIVVRPPDFQEHTPHFIICCNVAPSTAVAATVAAAHNKRAEGLTVFSCWPVPLHLHSKHWAAVLLQHADQLSAQQLVLPLHNTSRVLSVFAKFEDPAFIHTYMPGYCPGLSGFDSSSSSGGSGGSSSSSFGGSNSSSSAQPPLLPASGAAAAGMTWHLTRYSLQFELRSGGVRSLDHRGYVLSTQQLLFSPASKGTASYTLPEFQQYLVLQMQPDSSAGAPNIDTSEQLVLVLSGRVRVQRKPVDLGPGAGDCPTASVHVECSTACDAKLQVLKYDVHARFGHLAAHSTASRLQLAALYAACSTKLPEPRSKLTGAQTAMMLVRHSWTNEPLDAQQQQHLQDASALGGFHEPALRLLCHDLAASAAQLQHLYVPETGVGAAARHGAAAEAASSSSSDISLTDSAVFPGLGAMQLADSASDAVSEYLVRCRAHAPAGFAANPRTQLSTDEEAWMLHTGTLGLSSAAHAAPDWKAWGRYRNIIQLPQFPVAADYVQRAEAVLCAAVEQPKPPQQPPAFPLPGLDSAVPVAREMMQELQHSWDVHHVHPEPCKLVNQGNTLRQLLQGGVSLESVVKRREEAQSYLLQHLGCIPASGAAAVGHAGAAFRLLVTANSQPTASPRDLLSMAWGPATQLRAFNPFLSDDVCKQLQQGILIWLQLCVLEDRLERVRKLQEAGEQYTQLLIRELLTHRTWDVAQHPQWLVFEVEGRLQIRPKQHTLAKTLLDGVAADGGSPGPIAQLNMGEGKTRVILPMMVLHLADRHNLVRVSFLPQLLQEGKQHLQQHLTASVLGRKVFAMPFHRGVKVTRGTLDCMQAALAYCQKVGGVLVVAPEHRNSMYLKTLELALAKQEEPAAEPCQTGSSPQDLAARLDSLLNDFAYWDLLDESDEVLHHRRRQLVYAWGESETLPALEPRSEVIQSVLLLLSSLADSGNSLLTKEGLARKYSSDSDRRPGSFCGLQLLAGSKLDQAAPSILQQLAKALVKKAPMEDELGWLSKFPDEDLLLQLLTDREMCATSTAAQNGFLSSLPPDKLDQLLAAWGLLASGLLLHCLQSRHRVEYGINRLPGAKKRLAVPYRAADQPSPRSEFSQPEVAMIYTHLAYYGDGLSLSEFKAAVQVLLRKGPSEQAFFYSRWLARGAVCGSQDKGRISSFDSVDKIDQHNTQLMQSMHAFFSHNMEVINFWLATCVLPLETKQYPSRLVATAWHLAHNPTARVAGFSGTNDGHRLLPMQVQQVPLDDAPELEGTNGKMLDMLLTHASYSTLQVPSSTSKQAGMPVWKLLLQEALDCSVDAIIDCGALLAGVKLRSAAEYIMSNMPAGRYRGVTYFCRDKGCWVILDSLGRLAPKGSSHLAEADTLAIFDEARCRGSDLKLKQCAVGLLTLAPGTPKDKLMQAAGRLRQLGRGQTLRLVGLPDVSTKIWAAAEAAAASSAADSTAAGKRQPLHMLGLKPNSNKRQKSNSGPQAPESATAAADAATSMAAVLTWVMHNTVHATLAGVVESATNGLQFAATFGGAPEGCVWPEKLTVRELYGGSKGHQPVPKLLAATASSYITHATAQLVSYTAPAAADSAAALALSPATVAAATTSAAACDSSHVAPTSCSSGPISMSVDGSDSGSSSSDADDLAAEWAQLPVQQAAAEVAADVRAVEERFSVLGAGHEVVAGQGVDVECEMELQQEEEEEQEAEVELPAATAAAESDWEWSSAFTAGSPGQLRGCAPMRLQQVLQLVGSTSGVKGIVWSSQVWATPNFVHSIARGSGSPGLSDFLRPVGALLFFPGSKELLLLSEREADALQGQLWKLAAAGSSSGRSHTETKPNNLLLSLAYLRLACETDSTTAVSAASSSTNSTAPPKLFLASQLVRGPAAASSEQLPTKLAAVQQQQLPVGALVSVQLFAGAVMYGSQQQRAALKALMAGNKEAAQEILTWRGLLHMLPRSDLDRACADDTFV